MCTCAQIIYILEKGHTQKKKERKKENKHIHQFQILIVVKQKLLKETEQALS